MATLAFDQILTDHERYAAERAEHRAAVIPVRRARRVRLGDLVGLEFENAETLRYQVQEMVFTERLTERADVEHEIEAYGRLLPDRNTVCATFFIYLEDPTTIRDELARLQGVHTQVAFEAGGHRSIGVPVPTLDAEDDEVTVSVHLLRFPLSEELRSAVLDVSVPVRVVVDHPEYAEDALLPAALRAAMVRELTD